MGDRGARGHQKDELERKLIELEEKIEKLASGGKPVEDKAPKQKFQEDQMCWIQTSVGYGSDPRDVAQPVIILKYIPEDNTLDASELGDLKEDLKNGGLKSIMKALEFGHFPVNPVSSSRVKRVKVDSYKIQIIKPMLKCDSCDCSPTDVHGSRPNNKCRYCSRGHL